MKKTRIIHIITCLDTGGAEAMLFKLLSGMDREKFENEVVSMWDKGVFGPRMEELGVAVHSLEMNHGVGKVAALRKLRKLVQAFDPDWVQGWMYHGNLAATAAAGFSGRKRRVAWNIRHSVDRLSDEKRSTQLVIKAGAYLSRLPEVVICNSKVAIRQHENLGYAKANSRFIPNGFDLERFQPDATARSEVRAELNIPPDCPVVGVIQRWHPMKDHATFLRAVSQLGERGFHVIMAGRDVDSENRELLGFISDHQLQAHVTLLGERSDVEKVCNACDLLCVPSARGEGFPNIVGEAMACGVPCVVTDVGDAGFVVGETGIVVPPRDKDALCRGMAEMMNRVSQYRQSISSDCRSRIESEFGLAKVVAEYERLYLESDLIRD
tara:strand:+ start:5738 stop:6880 length:1143 start_codon:yes stop_codon:yes gene_type:complete